MVEINAKGAKRKANTVEGMRGKYLCTRGVGGDTMVFRRGRGILVFGLIFRPLGIF